MTLGGRTIAEWKSAMTQPEFLEWCEFYRMYPFDDMHRYHRPAAHIAQSIAGGDVEDRLEWLQPDPRTEGMSAADIRTMRAFGIKRG